MVVYGAFLELGIPKSHGLASFFAMKLAIFGGPPHFVEKNYMLYFVTGFLNKNPAQWQICALSLVFRIISKGLFTFTIPNIYFYLLPAMYVTILDVDQMSNINSDNIMQFFQISAY